jgi:hypothetical protein
MPRDKQALNVVLRIYALAGSCLVLAFLPFFLYRIGTERLRPVVLEGTPRGDGSIAGREVARNRRTRISAISMDGGPWVPAGGLTVAREIGWLPAGTPVSYREVSPDGVDRTIDGRVVEREKPTDRAIAGAALALVAIVFALVGAGMALSGVNRVSLFAAALLGGCGHFLAAGFAEPAASLVVDPGLRNGVVFLWGAFPSHLGIVWLVAFLSSFPSDLWSTRVARVPRVGLGGFAVGYALLSSIGQLPGTLERLPVAWQAAYLTGHRHLSLAIIGFGFLSALTLLSFQAWTFRRRATAPETRRRTSVVAAGLLVGIGPTFVLALIQAFSLAVRGKAVFSSLFMSLSFLPTLLFPPALAYAFLAPRVESAGILVRKAALFGFAAKTVRVVSLLPLAGLAFTLWTHRQSRLDELLAVHPAALLTTIGATILGLTMADRSRAAVERLFFRRKGDAARTLRDLAEKARETRNVTELADLLTSESDRALGLESAALFVRASGSDSYSCDGRSLPPLEGASTIVEEALRAHGPLEVAPDDPGSPLHGLPELERHWLEATRARLLVPLTGSDGTLLALLVLGDKRSELPFDREDEQLLAAAAVSAGLALENQVLRSSGGSSRDFPARVRTVDDARAGDEEAGLFCRKCARVFAAGSGALCPDDESPLEPASVPHLLAGKYRFEKRIGVGGMGVVYRARDVSLSRDVAIKVLPRVSHQAVRRLRREARAAARLIHPNLGLIFTAETWRGTPMLVLEFLDGGTLEDRIAYGPVSASDVVDWGIRLAEALEAAHAQGILHRDIKPSNIGFTTGGTPKLLDFGLVRLLDDPASAAADEVPSALAGPLALLDSAAGGSVSLTVSGRIVGTAPYLSPEAVQGHHPAPGVDLWGLTLTLYEALTGENPFAVAPVERAFNLILTVPAPDPRVVRPECPEPLAAFFEKALSKSPHDRPSTAWELRERLEKIRPSLRRETA